MRKAVPQNKMSSQGDTYAITLTECCLFILDESANLLSLLNHMRIPMNVMTDPTLSLGNLTNQWFRRWILVEKVITNFGNHCLNPYFLLHVPPMQPDSQFYTNKSPC